MSSLYRKYRPSAFSEVINQNHIKITLQNQIKTGKIGHAYLFCGPRGIGKTTLARLVAKAINCKDRKENDFEPCGKCSACEEIIKNSSLDITEIDAASHTGVDHIRENILAVAQTFPSKLKYKVFIIDEVHMLSTAAFNALLKIMEEPPFYLVFILCTTETYKVPETIISRCQQFYFKKIGLTEVIEKLEKIAQAEQVKVQKNVLEMIARSSGGHMRDAESLFGQIIALNNDETEITVENTSLIIPKSNLEQNLELLTFLSKKQIVEAINLIDSLTSGGVNLKNFTNDLIETLRKIMLSLVNPALGEKLGLEAGENLEKKIATLTQNLNLRQTINWIEEFSQALNNATSYAIPQLALEIALLKISEEHVTWTTNLSEINIPPVDKPPFLKPDLKSINQTQPSQPIPGPSYPVNQPLNNTNLQSVIAKWSQILSQVQNISPSTHFILKSCEIKLSTDNQLSLNFKYKFHKEQAEKPETKAIILQAMETVCGFKTDFINLLQDNSAALAHTQASHQVSAPASSIHAQASITPNSSVISPVQSTTPTHSIPPACPNTTESVTLEEAPKIEHNNKESDLLSNVLDAFGGKVVG